MSERRVDALYFGVLAAAFALGVATLWCVDYLPTNDGPEHIFLGHAENLYGDPSTIYHRQFVPTLQFAGRGFALWYDPLESVLGFRDAARVVLSLFFTWHFAGYVLLVRALGKSRRWLAPLGCGVALSWPLYMGLFPYYGGIGIGLLLLGWVARRPDLDRRTAILVGAALPLQFVHHAFSVVPTGLFLAMLVVVRSEPATRRATLVRLGLGLTPIAIVLLLVVWFRPANPPGLQATHWEPLARRALILPRVLWSGSAPTRWLGNALLAAGLVASILRFRRSEGTERAYILCAWTAGVLLVALPIVIPGWQFFNVRFAPFFVAFTLPLLPLELLRRPAAELAIAVAAACCFIVSAFAFHRSLRAACADDLAGLSLPVTRSGYRFPLVLEPFCGWPRDATEAPIPFYGPARQLGALYATAQGGTVPNAWASVPAIHPFTLRKGDDAPRVLMPDEKMLAIGEDSGVHADAAARRQVLQSVSLHAQSYDDVLLFGATDTDVATLEELGYRARFRQRAFAMMELEGCKTEVVIEDRAEASLIIVGGGLGGRPEITWERQAKPGPATQAGEIVAPVGQRLCGPGWIRVRYQVGASAFACSGTTDGRVSYVAKPGEVTRVRCRAPEL